MVSFETVETALVLASNSMGSSEIWDKYHECYIGNAISNIIKVVFS